MNSSEIPILMPFFHLVPSCSDALISSAVPENEATTSNDWEDTAATSTEADSLGINSGKMKFHSSSLADN